jgi:hypothetical protein
VIVATTDASLAANAYGHGFGLDVAAARHDENRGVLVVEVRAPKGAVIELVSAVDTDKPFARAIERCVKERNGGMYALVLGAADRKRALAMLTGRGATMAETPAPHILAFGARLFLE